MNTGFKYVEFIPMKEKPFPLEYATSLSSGIDLRAYIPIEYIVIPPGGRCLIGTGYRCIIHPDYEGQIRPRSGLAIKNGITVLNAPGTIDADYGGEICVILINHSQENYRINHGDKVAQFVLAPVVREPQYINDKERGEGGFGSTGV